MQIQFSLCAVSPLSLSSVLSFCAVSPPLSLNSVRCPHPSLNIWPQFHVRCPPQFWVICGVMCSNICFLILCGVPTPLRSSCQITISWMCDVPLPLTPETLLSTQCPPPLIYLISLAVNLAQLVSTSVALPAELVSPSFWPPIKKFILQKVFSF